MSLIEIKNSTETFASIDKLPCHVTLGTKDKYIDDFILVKSNFEEWAGDIVIPPYLCFEAVEDIDISFSGTPLPTTKLQYSIDNPSNWQDYTVKRWSTRDIVHLSTGQKCYWKGTPDSFSENASIGFNSTGQVKASGELDSLIAWGPLTPWCFFELFSDCPGLLTAPELPATTLAEGCYNWMFWNCTSLTTAPELPATTLAEDCYTRMFEGCTSLTTAPELPATTLAPKCYQFMFLDCTSLTIAPELPATELSEQCYESMFDSCTSLTSAPELPAIILADYCYEYMFEGCTSLTEAPELPSTELKEDCYYYMFEGCTSLTKLPELPATTLAGGCYQRMFENCSSIKLSTTQTGEYQTPYRIPTEGTGTDASGALFGMFENTGGTFTGTPTINTTYYGAW